MKGVCAGPGPSLAASTRTGGDRTASLLGGCGGGGGVTDITPRRAHRHRQTDTHINIHLYRNVPSIHPRNLGKSFRGRLGEEHPKNVLGTPTACSVQYNVKGRTAGSRLPRLRRPGTLPGTRGGSSLGVVVFGGWGVLSRQLPLELSPLPP